MNKDEILKHLEIEIITLIKKGVSIISEYLLDNWEELSANSSYKYNSRVEFYYSEIESYLIILGRNEDIFKKYNYIVNLYIDKSLEKKILDNYLKISDILESREYIYDKYLIFLNKEDIVNIINLIVNNWVDFLRNPVFLIQ